MRADMFKVIVERSRTGRAWADDGRRYRNDPDRPDRIGIKRGYKSTKHLNENLGPLKRYLHKHTGQPWNNVYSELCRHIDRRNAVQAHIFAHLDQFVGCNARVGVEGIEMLDRWYPTEWKLLRDCRTALFVHPETGLLQSNDERKCELRRLRAERGAKRRAREAEVLRIDANTAFERLDGIWYCVRYAPLPGIADRARSNASSPIRYEPRWDVKKRQWVALPSDWYARRRGEPYPVYAKEKRQIGKREIRRLGLRRRHLTAAEIRSS